MGLLASLAVSLWLNIGRIIYATPKPKMPPGPVYACEASNVTSVSGDILNVTGNMTEGGGYTYNAMENSTPEFR